MPDTPYMQFRWATGEEVVALVAGTTNGRICQPYLTLDGWLTAYLFRHDGLMLAAFHDTTTGKWVIPTGDGWPNVDPTLLASDAGQWIQQQQ
jgi:hypothetical protein